MVNVADLIQAVKEKKEYQSQLFDKVDFICRTLGKKYSNEVDTYIYEGDNLRFVLNEGDLMNKDHFKDVIVQTLDHTFFFNYLKNFSSGEERADIYEYGKWEKIVEQHYKMSLYNIK